jgi:hypothetical protein
MAANDIEGGDPVRHPFPVSIIVLIVLFCVISGPIPAAGQKPSSSSVPAKTWTLSKTPGGDPDLQGTWTSTTTTPLERPPQFGNRLFLTDQEYAESERQLKRQLDADSQDTVSPDATVGTGPPDHWTERASRASRQTSLVVDPEDGRVPVRASAEAIRDYNAAHSTDDFEYMSPWDRCITRGMPGGMFPGGYGNVYEIVQAPGYVAIVSEMIHETRIIPLDGQPPPNIRQWNGQSRGRWEGNTLVIDTTNYNSKGWIATNVASGRIKGIPQSESLHVIERLTRMDADTIQYEVTIEDPAIYTRPWRVAFPLYKDPNAQVFEYACHEGNYAMTNMLSGARAQEKAADGAAQQQR